MRRMPALCLAALLLPLASTQLVLPELPAAPEKLRAAQGHWAAVAAVEAAAAKAGSAEAAAESGAWGPHTVCADGTEQFSGFLPAGGGARYFFWLAHARSPTPSKEPLVIWLTGGPGCSSTLALLTENGPCHVAGEWATQPNPNSWTEAANVVWVDQPAGVGFSQGPAVSTERGVAEHMYAFLQSFYGRFPEFLHVPLFIMGESYAGHYVPAIASRIMEEPTAAGSQIQLQGIGIGNGLVNPWPQLASKPAMAYTGGVGGSLGRGVIGRRMYDAMEIILPRCHQMLVECQRPPQDQLTCYNAFQECVIPQLYPIVLTGRNPYDMRMNCTAGYPLCYDFSREAAFLRDPDVQKSLGVQPPRTWQSCNTTIALAFVLSGDWLQRFDERVVDLLKSGVRVLVYSGDTDYMVDWIGSKHWLAELEWPHRAAWAVARDEPFIVHGHPHGRERTAAGLTFLQMYDSGHLVPRDQPQAALAMLREFLSPRSRWAAAAAATPAATEEPGAAAAAGVAVLLGLAAALLVLRAWQARRAAAGACGLRPLLAA